MRTLTVISVVLVGWRKIGILTPNQTFRVCFELFSISATDSLEADATHSTPFVMLAGHFQCVPGTKQAPLFLVIRTEPTV